MVMALTLTDLNLIQSNGRNDEAMKRLIFGTLIFAAVCIVAPSRPVAAQDSFMDLPGATAADLEDDARANFKPNPTFDRTMRSALRKTRTRFFTRVKVWRALRDNEMRYELELALTEKALAMGIIQPEGIEGTGVYGGPWTDFLDWIINNWDEIFRIIMTIIDLFSDDMEVVDCGYSWPADDEIKPCSMPPQCSGASCQTVAACAEQTTCVQVSHCGPKTTVGVTVATTHAKRGWFRGRLLRHRVLRGRVFGRLRGRCCR